MRPVFSEKKIKMYKFTNVYADDNDSDGYQVMTITQ